MSLEDVKKRAMTDGTFRSRLIADPVTTVSRAGISLSRSEMDTLRSSIEQLRTNKTASELDQVFRAGALGW
jgi:hypothetical protein